MKKLLLGLIVPILFMSCISSGEDITVHKDGSGQLIQTFKIKKDFVGFLNLSDQPSDPNLIDMKALKESAAAMGEGVILEKVVPMPKDSPYAGYKAYYTFTDISKIKANASPATAPETGETRQNRRIHFSFTPGTIASLTIFMPDEKTKTAAEGSGKGKEGTGKAENTENPKMKEQLKQIYKDMHYWITVKVDGHIIHTNAQHNDGSTITLLDMTFDKIVNNDKLFSKVTSNTSENMNDYMDELTAAGVIIENQQTINVKFK